MKTSKSKEISRPKKTTGTVETVKRRKITTGKSAPGVEEIRKKAFEIYNQRIGSGKYGTASDDWNEAERLLRNSGDFTA